VDTATQVKISSDYSIGSDEDQTSSLITIVLEDEGFIFVEHEDAIRTDSDTTKIPVDSLLQNCMFKPDYHTINDEGRTLIVFYDPPRVGKVTGEAVEVLKGMYASGLSKAHERMIIFLNAIAAG